jgi:hypothetical protein
MTRCPAFADTDIMTTGDHMEHPGPFQYRISTVRGTERIWRKEHNPAFYGGYQIKYIQTGTRVANEWIANATRI